MKVLICVRELHANTGLTNYALEQARFFTSWGHKVFVLYELLKNPRALRQTGAKGVRVVRWPVSGYKRRSFFAWQANRWIKKHKPDLVIGHGDIIKQDILFMHTAEHLTHELVDGKPLPSDSAVGRFHECVIKGDSYRLCIVASEMMKEDFILRFGCKVEKIKVLPWDINPANFSFKDAAKERLEYRNRFKIQPDEFVVGFVSACAFQISNLGSLLEAIALLKKDYPKIKLLVSGSAARRINGGDRLYHWLNKVAELKIKGRVEFLPFESDPKQYYNMIDLFVLPSYIEEFGKAALEAMYCGKAVILGANVGASEILEGKSRDYILRTPFPESIAAKIKELIDAEALRAELGAINHNTALKYSTENIMQQFGQMLVEAKWEI